MNQAQADERFRKVKIVFEKLLRDIERQKGEKIVIEPRIRIKSQFESEKERWRIEEDPGCGS